jgi:short-subunit dehydrogenase
MRQLAAELNDRHGVEAVVEAVNLAEHGAATALHSRLNQRGIDPDVLVNNAAFGLSAASSTMTQLGSARCFKSMSSPLQS